MEVRILVIAYGNKVVVQRKSFIACVGIKRLYSNKMQIYLEGTSVDKFLQLQFYVQVEYFSKYLLRCNCSIYGVCERHFYENAFQTLQK